MIAIGLLFVRMLCDCFKPRQQLQAEILVLRQDGVFGSDRPCQCGCGNTTVAIANNMKRGKTGAWVECWKAGNKNGSAHGCITNAYGGAGIGACERLVREFFLADVYEHGAPNAAVGKLSEY
jgi:hypothetical protein